MSAASYILPASTSQHIFDTEILPHELNPDQVTHHLTDGQQPLAVLIVGQTGAGKTRLAPLLLSALAASPLCRRPAHFIADTYKTHHPSYATLLSTNPALASAAAGPDARRWLAMACAAAAGRRADALVESACRHPDDFARLAALFRAARYRVAVAVLAAPAALSRLGVLVRFHLALPEARSGALPLRLTPRRVHDESYVGLGEAAAFVDAAEGVVDEVVVVRRGNKVAYENWRDGEGRWVREAGARRALERERRRPLGPEEHAVVTDGLAVLEGLGDQAGVAEQVAEIRALVQALGEEDGGEDFPTLVPLDAVGFLGRGLS